MLACYRSGSQFCRELELFRLSRSTPRLCHQVKFELVLKQELGRSSIGRAALPTGTRTGRSGL